MGHEGGTIRPDIDVIADNDVGHCSFVQMGWRPIAIVTQGIKKEDGQGRVNLEITRELLDRGHSLVLVAFEVPAELRLHPRVRWVRIPGHKVPTYLLRDQIFALFSAVALWRLRRVLSTVVVNGFVTWWPGDVNLVHFVHTAWRAAQPRATRLWHSPTALYRWLYTSINTYLERVSFRGSEVIVAVSPLVRGQLNGCGVAPERIRVVPNGVDLDVFFPGEGDRASLGLPQNCFIVLFAGDIRTSRKNLESVLKALSKTSGIHLAVAGDTFGSPYPTLARTLGVADRVHFLGLRRDLPDVMRAVDAFILPSRFEPFGLVLLEANASGLPVITSRASGACEALPGEGMIILHDPNDILALAAALDKLSGDIELLQRMGQRARAEAECLSWKAAVTMHAKIIEAAGTHLTMAARTHS